MIERDKLLDGSINLLAILSSRQTLDLQENYKPCPCRRCKSFLDNAVVRKDEMKRQIQMAQPFVFFNHGRYCLLSY